MFLAELVAAAGAAGVCQGLGKGSALPGHAGWAQSHLKWNLGYSEVGGGGGDRA